MWALSTCGRAELKQEKSRKYPPGKHYRPFPRSATSRAAPSQVYLTSGAASHALERHCTSGARVELGVRARVKPLTHLWRGHVWWMFQPVLRHQFTISRKWIWVRVWWVLQPVLHHQQEMDLGAGPFVEQEVPGRRPRGQAVTHQRRRRRAGRRRPAAPAVQLHPHGGQFNFVWLSARTPHGAYVW